MVYFPFKMIYEHISILVVYLYLSIYSRWFEKIKVQSYTPQRTINIDCEKSALNVWRLQI